MFLVIVYGLNSTIVNSADYSSFTVATQPSVTANMYVTPSWIQQKPTRVVDMRRRYVQTNWYIPKYILLGVIQRVLIVESLENISF